ncbi:reverse transcriptase family protein [Pseudomonas sp. 39167]|jgi:hypothetical protein|uniref:reverse transcriptase family protein n=1 Tax=Pseudomonas sp. 39167 TaxID=2967215 RepID=UPI002363C233|nr:reverse transcriptase family protein [Pseudomonas sp. 39167]MDD2032852.1 reverse transcriptase family protein [Pseudomonas sp. 39167]
MANDKPYYSKKPIGSVEALAQCLGVTPERLLLIAKNAEKSYVEFTIYTGKDKNNLKERILHEPKPFLKSIQKKINREVFEHVIYPEYLHGGLKERDYVTNVSSHAGAKTIIAMDIQDFYPSIQQSHVQDIFTLLCKFPPSISSLITDLITINGRVAQGACCSSYIANLIFFNSEYGRISKFRSQGLTYTRLLDDITISSRVALTDKQISNAIESVTALFTKFDLKLHPRKTKIEQSTDTKAKFEVTGLWAKHGNPKIRKKDRHYVRHLVFICQKEYEKNSTSNKYHELWNMTSGKVAVLTRLKHAQSKDLRKKLGIILPTYDSDAASKLQRIAYKLCNTPEDQISSPGKLKTYHKLKYHFGIVARTDRPLAKKWKGMLDTKFKSSADAARRISE